MVTAAIPNGCKDNELFGVKCRACCVASNRHRYLLTSPSKPALPHLAQLLGEEGGSSWRSSCWTGKCSWDCDRGYHGPEECVIYMFCPTQCKEKTQLLPIWEIQWPSPHLATPPTNSSLTARSFDTASVCGTFFFTCRPCFCLDSLEAGCLRFLGTFFWGSQILSSLSSSSEPDDLEINWQENF